MLFAFNVALIVSDGPDARIGTLTAGREWFKRRPTFRARRCPVRACRNSRCCSKASAPGAGCARCRPPALLREFMVLMVLEDDGSGALAKKMAGYHRFHAVETAVAGTLRAATLLRQPARVREERGRYELGEPARRGGGRPAHRRRLAHAGVKSLTMAFYAGRIVREPAMRNPTVVVLTDRNDLDDQLFTTFSRCADLLRQPPSRPRAGPTCGRSSRWSPAAWCSRSSSRRRRATAAPHAEALRIRDVGFDWILRETSASTCAASSSASCGSTATRPTSRRRPRGRCWSRRRSCPPAGRRDSEPFADERNRVLSGRVRRDQVGENPPAGGWPVADLMMRGCATR